MAQQQAAARQGKGNSAADLPAPLSGSLLRRRRPEFCPNVSALPSFVTRARWHDSTGTFRKCRSPDISFRCQSREPKESQTGRRSAINVRSAQRLESPQLRFHCDKTNDVDFLPVVKICLLMDDFVSPDFQCIKHLQHSVSSDVIRCYFHTERSSTANAVIAYCCRASDRSTSPDSP